MAGTHKDYRRRAKPCVKCGKNETMPSSSYCKICQKAYQDEKKERQRSENTLIKQGSILKQVIQGQYHD